MADPCEKSSEIATLEQSYRHMLELLREVSGDVKAMRTTMEEVSALAIKHEHQQEAIERAFLRIGDLEKGEKEHEAFVNQVQGMVRMAWTIWGLLTGGVFVVALKVFKVIGG